ncbi:MAG: tRNA (N6-threonylcarbamoyladenosine(37)-N6)-methyltransferase TrmO [Clostridiales bacterium]|nr:tRNA (N6-threonylcarbamoyladenosine(37)-N6)-methyltransferase TrmO [Clostridiales bacterium]
MHEPIPMKTIAVMRSSFPTKFGIPRQSGLVEGLRSTIVFAPEYRNPDALRGLEGFSHLWLIWSFSQAIRAQWSPTVRPPRLGGNTRMGVFATRSPFRPNPIGLSAVKLEGIELHTPDGPLLHVSGADLLDGTPIFDIKPYLPYADAHPEAAGGFAAGGEDYRLTVDFPPDLLERLSLEDRLALPGVLEQDPRPSYQDAPDRVYGMAFGSWEVKFSVQGKRLTVLSLEPRTDPAP